MKKKPVVLVSVLGLIVLLLIAYLYFNYFSDSAVSRPNVAEETKQQSAGSGNSFDEKPVTVLVTTLLPQRVEETVSAVGSTVSYESVILSSEISGRISTLRFADGGYAKKSQLLIALDASTQLAKLKQAKANADLARIHNQRNQELGTRGFVSKSAVDETEYKYRVALADLALAEAEYQKTQIKAPFDGVLGIRKVNVGDYIKEGQSLVNIENISNLYVDFQVPEIWLPRLHIGLPIDVAVDAYGGEIFSAKVIAIDPQVQKSGRSFSLRAILPNDSLRLKPGLFVRISLKLGFRDHVLMVPETAIASMGTDQFVYEVIDNRAIRKRVTTGIRQSAMVEITKGLSTNATVIIAGHQKLKDNQVVKTQQSSEISKEAS